MINPSHAWLGKLNDTLLPECFVEVTYGITELGIQEDAVASSNGEAPFSNILGITDSSSKRFKKISTGELNLTLLNGEFLFPDPSKSVVSENFSSAVDTGFISHRCVSSTNHPKVTLSFSKITKKQLPGITIVWSTTLNEFADSFKVACYKGGALLSEKAVTGNKAVRSEVMWEISGFDSISVEVLSWCIPGRRARIEGIDVGIFVVFTKKDLVKFSHESSRDPISGSLPKDEIKFSVDNSDQRWNPLNPQGLYKYLYDQQPVTTRYGMDVNGTIEWIPGGRFYLSEWSVPSNGLEASFVARDVFSILMKSTYTGRKYGTLYEFAYDALELLADENLKISLSDELKGYQADIMDESSEFKDSDILQMVANAAGMSMYQSRDSVIYIKRIPSLSSAKQNAGSEIVVLNNFSWPEVEFLPPVSSVSCTVKEKSGDTITSKTVSYPTSPSKEGAQQTVSNPMVSKQVTEMPQNILTEAYKLLSNRKKVTLEYRASPFNDALDYIKIHSQFDHDSILLATEVKYTFDGSFRGSVNGYLIGE